MLIACRGPVLSVNCFSRGACRADRFAGPRRRFMNQWRSLGCCSMSGLASIPRSEPLPIGSSLEDTDADAVLLIGDRAIHPPARVPRGSSDNSGRSSADP